MNRRVNINKTLGTVIGLNLIQIFVMLGFITIRYIENNRVSFGSWFDAGSFLLLLIVVTSLFNSLYIIRDARHIVHNGSQYEMLKDSLTQVEELNKTLRAQRHDFINHLQVVHSLIEMDEYREARSYVERIFSDIQKVSRSLKTSNAAINALLQAKILSCEKKGIQVVLQIASQLKGLKVPSWEMCRILGNIIDNAIYALMDSDTEKTLKIEIFEDHLHHFFTVEDNGPVIPPEILNRIFEPGFTTKGAKGEGMGLAITHEIVTTYGGTIEVRSQEQKTIFAIRIPHSNEESSKMTV